MDIYDELLARCTDLADLKHEIAVALEEIASGEIENGIGRLMAVKQ